MNEEPTKELPDRSSFEELVIARFDSIDARFDTVDARFDTVDARLEKLESRSHDTKPIWQRALKAIMEMGLEMGEVKNRVGAIEGKVDVIGGKVDVIETKVGVIETKVQLLENEIGVIKTDHRTIRNELVDMRRELKHHVSERLDLILKFLLEDREDIRDAEDKIRQLETKLA
jgi:predicted  nucleic acid-binding Zn-ribbon protein